METIAGEWFMKGCRRTDKDCLHSPEDLLALVQEIGFLPLFSNDIPGFSVEERTPAEDWWAGSPATDPWAWRQVLAPCETIAYGKFFDKKAGFVSKEWFPCFANWRRDGYDYEGLYEDGKMTSRCKRILDILELNENAEGLGLLSCEIKRRAALEKGFEGALTDLQMKSFLIMSDFRQRRNKRGESYGWHVAELMTPETKWGYDAVNSCSEKPEASRDRIAVQIRKHFPKATDRALRKVLGI
ncbi:AlkZ-related protein [Aristaeella lactis]|uniref:Uncharacterized protein n=1 Tax=Aristaeella lactis TaxID=3046383 RepID=A0AC61PL71_9FIRM|nr:hypothetical protein [Aristaeella lactis]QUA52225.1 hypothetical protein JYE50_10930 [Aristaeella lactis]SMC59189.1 hypothetical protein SAMN06297397_1607 [Aristaeella lactis]